MAGIYKVVYSGGKEVVRVVLKKRRYPIFCLAFDDWNAACEWVDENEEKYYEKPVSYFIWRERLFKNMRKTGELSCDHVIRPRRILKWKI